MLQLPRHPDRALAWPAPILCVSLGIVLVNTLRSWLDLGLPRLEIDPDRLVWSLGDVPATVSDLAGRLHWGLAALVLVVAVAVAVPASGGVVLRALLRHRPGVSTWIWGGLFAGATLWVTVIAGAGEFTASIPSFYPILDRALPGVRDLAAELNRVALLAAIWLTFGAASLLLSAGPPAKAADLSHLRLWVSLLHRLLYLGAIVLVAGVLEVHALHRWALALLSPADAESLSPLAQAVATAVGTYWTLLLLGIYAPVKLFLDREAVRAGDLADSSPEQRRTWLEEQGLTSNPWQLVLRVGAIVSPFLAGGPLSSLLDLLHP